MKVLIEKMKQLIMKSINFYDISIELLDVLRATHDKDWTVTTHHHPWFEFNYVSTGSLYTTIENTEFLVQKGESYLIPPGISHSHTNNLVGDDGICIRWQLHKINETNIYFNDINHILNKPIKQTFTSGIESISFSDNHLSNQADFLSWIFHLYANFAENTHLPQTENHISYQVILYLNEYYNRKVGVQELSESLNISYRNLSRIFMKQTGITITQKLNEIRINQAKKLLIKTSIPIYEIAEQVGFENEYYFSNTFKRYSYCSPLQFRKMMKN